MFRPPAPAGGKGPEADDRSPALSPPARRRMWRVTDGVGALPRAIALAALVGLVVAPGTSLATVAEQRARLPPPAKCKDEVEGIWKAHHYRDRYKIWDLFTLEVHRKPGNKRELEG